MLQRVQSQIQNVSDVLVREEKIPTQIPPKRWHSEVVYDELMEPWPGHSERGPSGVIYSFTKRLFDVIGASLGLIFSLPLMAIIACLVKLDSPGPVLFRQMRIGQNRRRNTNGNGYLYDRRNRDLKGKPIFIYKFRTMKNGVEQYAISPNDNLDPRLTRVGRVIRRLCLDELPQFLNVIWGDMSLVGPRPEMPFIVKNYGPIEALRLVVKPGISGLWQLNAPRTQFIHENLQYDLDYIRRRSLMLDFKIMFKTVGFMLNFRNI